MKRTKGQTMINNTLPRHNRSHNTNPTKNGGDLRCPGRIENSCIHTLLVFCCKPSDLASFFPFFVRFLSMKYVFVGTKTEMNKSARRGAQLVPIGMPTLCWKHVTKLNQYVVNQKLNHLYYINFRQRSCRFKYNQRVHSCNHDYIHYIVLHTYITENWI